MRQTKFAIATKLSDGAFGARDPGGNIRNVTAAARL
jgi:hypothetical protein